MKKIFSIITSVLLLAVPAATFAYNDPGYDGNPRNIDKQWGLVKVNVEAAQQLTRGVPSVVVAVIDTGVDQTHEDFSSSRFVEGYDFQSRKFILVGSNSDDNGHGTLVAGSIVAQPNNGVGIVGIAPGVSIMPIKVLDRTGSGTSTAVSEAIRWAVDHGASVINMSFGATSTKDDTDLLGASSYAYRSNVVLVAAAGNDSKEGINTDVSPVYPSCSDGDSNYVIGVTAVDVNDQKHSFADYGSRCVDVSAPGTRILSLINHDPLTASQAPNKYVYGSGTSIAASFVSAQAALIRSLYPGLSVSQVRDRIRTTTDPIDSQNISQCMGSCAGMIGTGRINILRSLAAETRSTVTITGEGGLVRVPGQPTTYLISGGVRRPVSPQVYNSRYSSAVVSNITDQELQSIPIGPYAAPVDGTLVKSESSPAVYAVIAGVRRPVSATTFRLRGYRFADVQSFSSTELNSWPSVGQLLPPDGTMLKSRKTGRLYWVVGDYLHEMSRQYYTNHGLSIFTPVPLSDAEVRAYPLAEPYR